MISYDPHDDPIYQKYAENTEQVESEPWPVIRRVAFLGIIGDFVDLACRNSEADPVAVLITLLVRCGIEAGTGPHVMVGESRHHARLFAVITGASSKARKGTSKGPVDTLFRNIISTCPVSPGPLSSGEGLIYAVRDEQQEFDAKSQEWRTTDPGAEDKRLTVIDEEFAGAMQATKREGNTLSAILRGFWDEGKASPLTKSNRIKATDAHVGIISHTTLAELQKLLTENEKLNGFGNRFLWVLARRSKLVSRPSPMPDDEVCRIAKIFAARLGEAGGRGRFTFTTEAAELWDSVYPELTADHDGAAGCMVNRGEAQVIRLSLIYAILAGHHRIEIDDLHAALALWDYCYKSALQIFGCEPIDRNRLKLIEALKSDGGILTRTQIMVEVFRGHMKQTTLDALLARMVAGGIIVIEEIRTPGAVKPTQVVRLAQTSQTSQTSHKHYSESFQTSQTSHNEETDSLPPENIFSPGELCELCELTEPPPMDEGYLDSLLGAA